MRSFGRRADYVFKTIEGAPGQQVVILAESPEYAELIVIAADCFHEEAAAIHLRMTVGIDSDNRVVVQNTQALGGGGPFDRLLPMPIPRELIIPPRGSLAISVMAVPIGKLRGRVMYRVRYIEQLS